MAAPVTNERARLRFYWQGAVQKENTRYTVLITSLFTTTFVSIPTHLSSFRKYWLPFQCVKGIALVGNKVKFKVNDDSLCTRLDDINIALTKIRNLGLVLRSCTVEINQNIKIFEHDECVDVVVPESLEKEQPYHLIVSRKLEKTEASVTKSALTTENVAEEESAHDLQYREELFSWLSRALLYLLGEELHLFFEQYSALPLSDIHSTSDHMIFTNELKRLNFLIQNEIGNIEKDKLEELVDQLRLVTKEPCNQFKEPCNQFSASPPGPSKSAFELFRASMPRFSKSVFKLFLNAFGDEGLVHIMFQTIKICNRIDRFEELSSPAKKVVYKRLEHFKALFHS